MRGRDLLLTGAALLLGLVLASFAGSVGSAHGQAKDETVADMDLDFLREKLLKMWIVEIGSDRHNRRKIAEKSFAGLTPFEPTGNAELDAENKAEYLKNDKHLRHYLTLELDNAVEIIDICSRVLGRHVRRPASSEADVRALMETELPALSWSDVPLADALQDLGGAAQVPISFSGLAPNEEARIDIQFPKGFILQQAIEFIQSIHPMSWTFEDGVLHFTYGGD